MIAAYYDTDDISFRSEYFLRPGTVRKGEKRVLNTLRLIRFLFTWYLWFLFIADENTERVLLRLSGLVSVKLCTNCYAITCII